MRKKLALLIASLFLVFGAAWAQAPVATPAEAITGLLNRIGGNGAADLFEIVIDANLAENGKDVFVITSQNGKPCIKGNTQLSVATGINWYLNHYAHINLTWNNLTTDLSGVSLPVPTQEEKHVCNTTYRYNFNTCTFSYSMAFWTWERWQQEIDWMALHGINAPLNLVGLDVVTRKFLRELGVSENDINAYIAGPGFIAWFAMNNLEGWGGTINSSSTGVNMSGNPGWWYTRQENLCRNMLQRMRELGMQPVIPGFSGQVPNCITNYNGRIDGFNSAHVLNNGTWAGGFTRPDMLYPNTTTYEKFAAVYYKHLHDVMGVSELYSIDPFHEGGKPAAITNAECYPNIMKHLDIYHDAVDSDVKNNYRVNSKAKWIIQYWQGIPETGAFSSMSSDSYKERFIGLDLFADNIYAGNAAKWREANINNCYYQGRPYVYCMLHNFGGRSGMHGRLETTMDGYFQALAKGNNCQGIGATPEGIETNPILYDMLFELPWMDVNNRPTADEWLAQYNQARYGTANEKTLEALKLLKKSVWDCKVNQQGTSEAVILARPNWTVGSVSTWSTSAIYWDTQDVLEAADLLVAAEKLITSADGIANYNYDVIDVIRQAMVDYAAELLPLINAAKNNDAEYTRLYQLYLRLMLDLDTMLSYDENFKLERWTSLARNIADEVSGTTENDRNWLEWNARTQITVWADTDKDLHDYSNRCWAGLIKDFHYKRWEKFFTTKGGSFSGGWFSGFEYPWTVDFNNTYNLAGDYSKVVIPTDMTATQKAVETFGKYFGRVKGATKNYIFPMGITRKATASDVIPEVYRGKTVDLPLEIGKNVTITSVWVDLNNDGAKGNGETLTATNNQVAIPADATIGKTTAQVVYSDGTDITFNLALVEDITENRTVTAVAGANGSVAIEGTNELSITNAEAVKMTATANTGYNFENWTDANSNVVSNDNPYIYYGKEAATFTANFIQDKWGVPTEDKGDWGNATVKTSFVNQITFAYHDREPETIYEASVAPENLFNTIPQIINVPRGASFDITWSDDNNNGLKYCYLSAYYDYDGDGVFELLETKGKRTPDLANDGSNNLSVCDGKINVLLPYDAPLGITHMRLRFDGGWKTANFNATTKAYDAKAQLNRMCYELIINVTDGSAKAAHVIVESNNDEWGTAEVWTDETPGWTASNEWDVSASIPVHIKATKASEDVEFLGWYDHYGRLLTTELEYSMYAREDATYTAKFRKELDIDGWVFKYRTEPGSEIVTTKLANGVKPESGKIYYIYAPTRPDNAGEYVNRYLYNNSGTLTLSTTESTAASYLWMCGVEDGKYTFQNVADPTKYLKHKGLANAPYGFELGTGATHYEGLTLKSVPGDGETRNLFFVINDNGSGFNHSEKTHNQSTEDFTTDFVFTKVSTPDVVILTSVRQSGDHDLEIPETVDILGEQCKIVGFDNGVFNNNKDLWSITMPKSMEFLSEKSLFNHTLTGTDNSSAQTFGVDIKNNEAWTITMDVKRTGELTGWGSCLIASGSNPAKPDGSNYAEGFQFYLQSPNNPHNKTENDKLIIKTKTQVNDNWYFDDIYQEASFKVIITYNGAQQLSVNVLKADGTNATNHNGKQEPIVFTDCTIQDIKQLCTNVQSTITANVKIDKTAESNPFSGCSNLGSIAFSEPCANYYIAQDGDLYNSSNVLICSPEGKNKADAIRALGTLIDNTKALMDVIATSIDPVGKATALPLTTTQGQDFYVSTNADQNTGGGNTDGAGIAGLVDNNEGTHFHSRWGGDAVTAPHHIKVDLGQGNEMSVFQFSYVAHNAPDPTEIVVSGSNDGENFNRIDAITKEVTAVGATYTSKVFEFSESYRYLLFEVTKSSRSGFGSSFGNYVCFGMKEFDLFKLIEVAPVYKNLAGITNDEVSEVYDYLLKALHVYKNGGTAEEMQVAYDALKPLYTALNAKKGKVLNGVYHIKFGGAPIFVAHSPALDNLTGAGTPAYRLFDATTTNTSSSNNNKRLQDEAIAAKVAGDELFTIVPNSDITGYTISAQGLYMQTTSVASQWCVQSFSTDEADAGVYLIEDVSEGVFKLKSNKGGTQYVNDWGPVFGNDEWNKTNLSTFSFTPVTEYTLTVPTSGVTTLCLPFNVVLPEGVTAYEANLDKKKNYTGYALEPVASAGETLAKNTPVIIKATAADYTLTITMDEEGAKHATANNVLSSGLIKTTVAPANTKYAFDGENFKEITANTEVAANQCWMELSENCGSVIYGSAPAYLLTTDEANPILYKIIIKRAEDGSKVLQYDEPTSEKIKIVDVAENKSYQAWYFVGSENGILIKPYNANGKVLSVQDTDDGREKAMIAPIEEGVYQHWDFTKSTVDGCTDYYYVRVCGTNNAVFSHNGGFGVTSYMGIWSGGWNSKDGGSLFKFEEVEFPNDNPRFYQLSDVKAILTDGNGIPAGSTVGLYSKVEPYREACETASALIEAGNTSASVDCYDAYKALRSTKAAITYNEPDESKFYTIKSVSDKDYCKGKFVRTSYEPAEHDESGVKYDHRHLVFDAANAIPQQSLAIFQFVKTGTIGEYLMKNLHTGLYVKNFAKDAEHMGTIEEAQPVVISGYTDGAVTLKKKGDTDPMHAQDTHDVIVTYGVEPGNASTWVIEEADMTNVSHAVTISNYKLAGLYLNYPVEIPGDLRAYYVSTANSNGTDGVAKLVKIENGVIPANEGVILEGEAGTYDMKFSSEGATTTENLLEGSTYTGYIAGETGTKYYLFGAKSGVVGLYWTYLQYNPDGTIDDDKANTDNGTHFKCSANKIYLPYNAGSGATKFSFRFDDVTSIDDLLEELNGDGETYDLQGRRVTKVTKSGIYIVNGKKRYINAK